jgi:hypothetical protein
MAQRSRITATVLTIVLAAVPAGRLVAQSGAGRPLWETLVRAPLPEDSESFISINSLSVPAEPVPEHSHASPIFAHKAGGFFDAPVQLLRYQVLSMSLKERLRCRA